MEQLVASLDIQHREERSCEDHPRFSDFKNEGKLAEGQRKRREEHLRRQSNARDDWLNRRRTIDEHIKDGGSPEKKNAFAPRRRPKGRSPYKNMLMLSDWLVDIPGTLSSEWTMMPSPVGRRCLVVANNQETSVYFKNGNFACRFESALPGGRPNSKGHLTILDCICKNKVVSASEQFYVLDLLWWNNQMFTDTEFTFRQFFLHSKLQEYLQEDVISVSSADPNDQKQQIVGGEQKQQLSQWHQFLPLTTCPCLPEAMAEFMNSSFPYELDGLLFYYNSAFYIPEQTPLVGWLKPWMLPEILGVPVPKCFENEQCANSKEFIMDFNKKYGHQSSTEINEERMKKKEEEEEKKKMKAEKKTKKKEKDDGSEKNGEEKGGEGIVEAEMMEEEEKEEEKETKIEEAKIAMSAPLIDDDDI